MVATSLSLYNNLKNINAVILHGACLDGGISSWLLQKYGGLVDSYSNPTAKVTFSYIPPGEPLINELNETKDRQIALVDLALPTTKDTSILSHTALIIDHHGSSKQYVDAESKAESKDDTKKYKIIYEDDYCAAGIIWTKLMRKPLEEAPLILQAINYGDIGRLSKDEYPDLFYIYCGLQSILELYRIRERNIWNYLPAVLGYIADNENNMLDGYTIIEWIKYYGALLFYDEYNYIKLCLIESNIGNTRLKIDENKTDTYRTIFIKNRTTLTSLVAGKTIDPAYAPLVMLVNPTGTRFSIRKIAGEMNADKIAKILDDHGGGHGAAASSALNIARIRESGIFDSNTIRNLTTGTIGNPISLPVPIYEHFLKPLTYENIIHIRRIIHIEDGHTIAEKIKQAAGIINIIIDNGKTTPIVPYAPTKIKKTDKVFVPSETKIPIPQ